MNNFNKISLGIALLSLVFTACDAPAPLIAVQEANIDKNPIKVTPLEGALEQSWKSKDLVTDTIPGMSTDKTYAELLAGKQGVNVIVAVIDSGTDINHEDLKNVIWNNTDEIPNNNICLLYTSPSPRDLSTSRMPSSA